jgi:hypothetical protein
VNFIRTSWGNSASPASSADVAKIRGPLQIGQASTRN